MTKPGETAPHCVSVDLKQIDQRFHNRGAIPALLLQGRSDSLITYRLLADSIEDWRDQCERASVGPGCVVGFPGRYEIDSIGLFFALAQLGAVAVPLPSESENHITVLLDLARATHVLSSDRKLTRRSGADAAPSALYQALLASKRPGLLLFTSGTTSAPNAAVHDLEQLCQRHRNSRPPTRILGFMQLDHIGGVNTMLHALLHGGTLVAPASRSPRDVGAAVESHHVQVLPVSPTFLNLMLLSGAIEQYDLSSLERITYGSESMPASVLNRLCRALPQVEMLQTYGTTEVGILKSKSQDCSSLWMQIGGDGYETKIRDGRLWIRAETAMLGYLNAPSPFDAEGFVDTGDQVECRGEWIRIIGRASDVINVGGQKVAPVEVESTLLDMPGVQEAAVRPAAHPLTGQVVAARVRLASDESLREFKTRMRRHCRQRLPGHAIPVKLELVSTPLVTNRVKRSR